MKKYRGRIGEKLIFGFVIVLLIVGVLGAESRIRTNQLSSHAEELYEHLYYVRKSVDKISTDIQITRVSTRDMVLSIDNEEQKKVEQILEVSLADIIKQFDILYERYPGPKSDVDEAFNTFIMWETATEDRINTIKSDEMEEVIESLGDQGQVGAYRVKLLEQITAIDDYVANRTSSLYSNYTLLNQQLKTQSNILISAIMLITLLISFWLVRQIRRPLNELTTDIQRFYLGDYGARSAYVREDEFGMLADAFNNMADAIQKRRILDDKATEITKTMLRGEDARVFFKNTLAALMTQTGAHMAAVYLLSKDKKEYLYYESIGVEGRARESFSADDYEGEFGNAILSKKWQYVDNISEDTRFVYLTPGGNFVPKEMITIPIVSGGGRYCGYIACLSWRI